MARIDSTKFYKSALSLHGMSAQGLNWSSKKSQEIRFDIILEMLPKNFNQLTLADAGCGFGDFYLYMKQKPKKYIGIDSMPEMCEITSKQTGCEVIMADICKDELPTADYFVCSGALNILNPFEAYQFIRNCYLTSKHGFIFNILYGNKKSETYNYMTGEQIKKIAKELGVKRVKMQTEYLKNDITVAFFKGKN